MQGDLIEMFDTSQVNTYKHCPRQYGYKYVDQLRKVREGIEGHDAGFGSKVHKALERYYGGIDQAEILAKFKDEYGEQLNLTDMAKTKDNGVLLLTQYFNYAKSLDAQFEVLSVEVSDTFEFVTGIPYTVKIDLVIKNKATGEVYAMDHKTTGKGLDYSYWQEFEVSSAITAYTDYCIRKYGQCSGVIINAIKCGFRQRAYRGEPAGFHYDFQRQVFNRTKEQISFWEKDTVKWMEWIEESKESGVFPLHQSKMTCGYCQYKELCISCNDEQVREVMYETHNPLEYLNKENK